MPSVIKEVEESSHVKNKPDIELQQKLHAADWTIMLDEETERAVVPLGVQLQPFLGGSLEEWE